jgi:predicted phage terminase large subunit-like protein
VRYWDLAASTDEENGCFTAGVLMAATYDNRFFIEDIQHGRWSPAQRNQIIKLTAQMDDARYGAAVVRIYLEQEPGSAGKEVAQNFIRELAGYVVRPDRVTGKKVVRAEPFAAQVEGGRVFFVTSTDDVKPWIANAIEEYVAFPDGKYCDIVDASSGSFMALTRGSAVAGVAGGSPSSPGGPGPSFSTPAQSSGMFAGQQNSGLRGFKPI